ncbi:unnamed protein product [Oncorhynchus mykiss]|uniref:Sulfotransferase n=1 Tax=Oncorhynchus mykiss TaxID=8022 RepID=A0A060W1Y6_ONCMY|nr:unnamed protein product [Oncorhynchus mykiss]
MEIVPWIEVEMKTVDYGSMPSPRLFASHLLPNLLPPGLRKRGKVIGRNPKDVACSFYHFHNVNRLLEDKEDFNTFLEEFLDGKGGYVFPIAYIFYGNWYSQKENFDIQFLTYEKGIDQT